MKINTMIFKSGSYIIKIKTEYNVSGYPPSLCSPSPLHIYDIFNTNMSYFLFLIFVFSFRGGI